MNKIIFDGENTKELSVSETIHQLRLDNKYLELQIINLQSKIDKANEILKKPQFEYDNIPCNYEEDIQELKIVLKEDK